MERYGGRQKHINHLNGFKTHTNLKLHETACLIRHLTRIFPWKPLIYWVKYRFRANLSAQNVALKLFLSNTGVFL